MATFSHTANAAHGSSSFAHVVEAASNMLGLWRQRIVTRRELGRLDERMLQDIGFNRLDADQEMSKPFWRE